MQTKLIVLLVLLFLISDIKGQIGRLPLSPVQKIEQKIGLTDVVVTYSRPSMRGRTIFGGLVPYNKLWRTGANRNTTIEFNEDFIIDGKRITEGKYAIFSIPSLESWEIILYTDTDNWDVPEVLDSSKIAASILVKPENLEKKREVFTISIGDFTNYAFDLEIYWSNTFVAVPIGLVTKEIMDKKIDKVLNGPRYDDYYAAAVYHMESSLEYERGLADIERAIEVTEKVTWWDLRVKAILLMKLERFEESKEIAERGLIMAEEDKRAYGINEFEAVLLEVNSSRD